MRLEKVEIHGFRSIKEMVISFTKTRHMVLVGKNESGKSNILKVLNLLSGEHKFESTDKREIHDGIAKVLFVLSLHSEEIQDCSDKFYKLFPAGIDDRLTDNLTVREFVEKNAKYILYVIHPDKAGYWSFWALGTVKTVDQWYRVANQIPEELEFFPPTNSFVNQSYINKLSSEKQEAVKPFLSKVTIEDINGCLREIIKENAVPDNYIFPVVNWEYSASEHDLPSYVNQNEFAGNPDMCLPLLSMFLLSNIKKEDIQSKLTEEKSKGTNSLRNLLNKISNDTNKYIKKNWKEARESCNRAPRGWRKYSHRN